MSLLIGELECEKVSMIEIGSASPELTAYTLDQIPQPVVITDADLGRGLRIIYVNSAMLRLTGYTRAEVLGQSPKMFQGKDTDQQVENYIRKQLLAGEQVEKKIEIHTKNGASYWTELNISPVLDADGKITSFVYIQHDFSKLKKAQDQYKRDVRLISTAEKIVRIGTWGYDILEDKLILSDGAYDIWEWDTGGPPPSIRDCNKFIDEEDRATIAGLFQACIETQAPYEIEVRAHSSKGTPLRVKVLGEPMIDEEAKTLAVVGAIRDITNEKRLEAELDETISQSRETEHYFSIARAIANIGVFDYWIDHDRLHWSDELFEMTGLCPDVLPGTADIFLSRIDSRDREEYRRVLNQAITQHEGCSITVRFGRPDGKMLHMAIIADVRDSNYGPRVVGIARDVTSEVEASQRLASEQARFRIIADTVSDVLWDFDLEKQSLWVTPNWPRKLGVEFDGTGADPREWLKHVIPDDRERVVVSVWRALDSDSDRWDCEFKIVDPHGTQAEVEIKSSILRNDDGAAHRILGNCRNITVAKRQQEGFTRSRALEAVGQMTGGIAHDFNNLLMIIQGNAELLEMKELDEDDVESVHLIMQASDAAASLTSRLLSFSGQSRLESASVDAGKLVEGVAVLLRSGLTASIPLATTIEPDLWFVEVDGRALEQAIINLTVNARDAIGHEGGRVQINCRNVNVADEMVGGKSNLVAGRYVCISVTDNGAGMTEQVKSRAFEPFFTTKDVGKGTGLGLSMVYGFAKQSGGGLEVYSEVGRGTTVNLYIPASEREHVNTAEVATDAADLIRAGVKVLVVEDQPDVRLHVEHLLVSAGFDVMSACDGNSALALLGTGPSFDLLFTDIIMPGGMNGVQLAEAAKKLLPRLRVLFTSGFPASAFDELGLHQGEDFALLKKPYKRDELILAISRILQSKVEPPEIATSLRS
ncbi:PAS domain S-box protein [Microcoleus sp. Pol14D5]